MALINNQNKLTKNISSDGIQILDAYRKGDLKKLSQCDLSTVVDSNGNTIIHIIATNLDKEAFEKLINLNNRCISTTMINKPNNQSDCPLHKALESLNDSNSDDHSIISYMITKLKADPNKPNKENLIVVKEMDVTSDSDSESYVSRRLDSNKNKSNSTQVKQNTLSESQKKDFIRKLTDKYVPLPSMSGGKSYMGHRLIKTETSTSDNPATKFRRNFYSGSEDLFTESGKNDTFRTKPDKYRNQIDLTSSQDRPKRDPEITTRYNEILKKIMEVFNLDEDKAKERRTIIKLYLEEKNPELKGTANDALKIKELEKIAKNKKELVDYWEKKVSKEADKIKAHMSEQAKLHEERKKNALEKNTADKNKKKPKAKLPRKPKIDSDTDASKSLSSSGGSDSDIDYDLDSNSESGSNSESDSERYNNTITTSDRPKSNADINKRYYNVLEKIKEYMGVSKDNDSEARERRTIIKLYLQKMDADLKNPELTGAMKDVLKIEKLEKIVADKKSFENYWNNVITEKEKNAIRSYMKGQAEKGEQLRKDRTTSSSATPSDSDIKPKKKTTAKKIDSDADKKVYKKDTKKDTKKSSKKTKVTENGYIHSDERIFSTEDY